MATCQDCKYYAASGTDEATTGTRHRNAPTPHKLIHPDGIRLPVVNQSGWCGEWEATGACTSTSRWNVASESDPSEAGYYDAVVAGAVTVRRWNGSAWEGLGTVDAWR